MGRKLVILTSQGEVLLTPQLILEILAGDDEGAATMTAFADFHERGKKHQRLVEIQKARDEEAAEPYCYARGQIRMNGDNDLVVTDAAVSDSADIKLFPAEPSDKEFRPSITKDADAKTFTVNSDKSDALLYDFLIMDEDRFNFEQDEQKKADEVAAKEAKERAEADQKSAEEKQKAAQEQTNMALRGTFEAKGDAVVIVENPAMTDTADVEFSIAETRGTVGTIEIVEKTAGTGFKVKSGAGDNSVWTYVIKPAA